MSACSPTRVNRGETLRHLVKKHFDQIAKIRINAQRGVELDELVRLFREAAFLGSGIFRKSRLNAGVKMGNPEEVSWLVKIDKQR